MALEGMESAVSQLGAGTAGHSARGSAPLSQLLFCLHGPASTPVLDVFVFLL